MKLKILIDTGTWLKLDKLYRNGIIREEFIIGLYSIAEIYITPQIEIELVHFSPHSWKKNLTYIIPIRNNANFSRALNDGFDEADSSIFGIDNIQEFFILTEDRPLLKYSRLYGINSLFFIEFLIKLLESDVITKNELYCLNQAIYDLKNIDKKLYLKAKAFAQRY